MQKIILKKKFDFAGNEETTRKKNQNKKFYLSKDYEAYNK